MQEKEAVEMDITNIPSKLVANADKLGAAIGFLTAGGGVNVVMESFTNALTGTIHLPDLRTAVSSSVPYIRAAAMLYLGGWIVGELNLPMIGKYGNAMKNGAVGYGAGAFLHYVLWHCTHSDQGSDPAKGGGGSYGDRSGGNAGYSY
jgi:hypothetical protein